MVYFIRTPLLNSGKSFWLVIVVLWNITFYGLPLTISILGATFMFLGFNDLNNKKSKI